MLDMAIQRPGARCKHVTSSPRRLVTFELYHSALLWADPRAVSPFKSLGKRSIRAQQRQRMRDSRGRRTQRPRRNEVVRGLHHGFPEQIMSPIDSAQALAVRELMSGSTVSVAGATRIRDALLIMERYGIRHLPVVEGGRVIGLVSKTDVREALSLKQSELLVHDRLDWPVSRIMSDEVLTVSPNSSVCESIDLLVRHQVGALPVVAEDDQQLVGMLSAVDILRAARPYFQ